MVAFPLTNANGKALWGQLPPSHSHTLSQRWGGGECPQERDLGGQSGWAPPPGAALPGAPELPSHHLLQLRACKSSACEMLMGAKQVFQGHLWAPLALVYL